MANRKLMEAIRTKLENSPLFSSNDIDVEAQGENIRIRGSVPSYGRKLDVQRMIDAIPGVSGILNRLRVLPHDTGSKRAMEETLRVAFKQSPDVPASTVHANWNAERVTLVGTVPTESARRAAEDIVLGMAGVREVSNFLLVDAVRHREDRLAASRIRRRLEQHADLASHVIHVTVANLVLFLHGSVSSPERKELAEKLAARDELLHLRNRIRVEQEDDHE